MIFAGGPLEALNAARHPARAAGFRRRADGSCDWAPSLASRTAATWRFQRVWARRLARAGQGGWQL